MLNTTLTSNKDKYASPTGLRVRDDLYDEDYSDSEYEQMLSMYEGTMQSIAEGEIVKSKVLRVTEGAVILDVGFKSEGSVSLDEFKEIPQVGDEVEVFLEHLEDAEGAVVLSKKKADFMRVWEKIRVAHESDQPVQGILTKKIKGGVVVTGWSLSWATRIFSQTRMKSAFFLERTTAPSASSRCSRKTSTSSPTCGISLNSSSETDPSDLKPTSRITAPSVTRRTLDLTISPSAIDCIVPSYIESISSYSESL